LIQYKEIFVIIPLYVQSKQWTGYEIQHVEPDWPEQARVTLTLAKYKSNLVVVHCVWWEMEALNMQRIIYFSMGKEMKIIK
jgi:hypothetical protein